VEKYRYFVLKDKGGDRLEYYRLYPNDLYAWWDDNTSEWVAGSHKTWTDKIRASRLFECILEETSPLEMVVLLGKKAVRMLQ
jgi:hypothetical protein